MRTYSFDPVELAVLVLAITALSTGSFTVLAIAVILTTFNLKLTWRP